MSSSLPYFETLGADWTRLQRQFFSDEVREKALEVAGVEAGQVAADLGAGTGFRAAGFSNVRVDGLGETCRATSPCAKEAAVGIFVASGTHDRVDGPRPEEG